MAASRDDLGGDPPESTQLRLGDDIAWSEINGVYDRDDSLKENTNPKSLVKNHHHHHPGGGGGSSSQRFSGNLKPTAAPIIGLYGKLGGSVRRHQQQHPPAMFPKKARTGGGGGRAHKAAVPEPGSPKVSCIGKVLSDRERARLGRPPRGRAPGCCGGLGLLMRRSRSRHSAVECVDDQSPPPPRFPALADAARRREAEDEDELTEPAPALGGARRFASGRRAAEDEDEVAEPAPGLGGVRRFSSGRRAAEWAAQMEDDGHVARSGPL